MTEIRLHRPDGTLCGTRYGCGPPILLLHAGGEDRRVWTPVAARLLAAGFAAIAYDLRGHGDSTTGSAIALPALAADVTAMLDGLVGGVIVVGASLGGLAALHALADPQGASDRRRAGPRRRGAGPAAATHEALSARASLGARPDEPLIDDILDRAKRSGRPPVACGYPHCWSVEAPHPSATMTLSGSARWFQNCASRSSTAAGIWRRAMRPPRWQR